MTDRPGKTERSLFDAACSGRLDEAGLAQLQALLRTSPEARRRYLDYTAMHADLFGAVRTARVRNRLEQALADQAGESTGANTSIAKVSPRRRALVASAVAFFATAAALLLMVLPNGGDQADQATVADRQAASDVEVDNWPGLVARVNRVEQVQWKEGERRFAPDERVAAGESIVLASGMVEIEFRQGAVVVLEGPAHLIAAEANAASLLQGKLAAVAPPWATGFRVDTPGVDVVDHGTEFAVSVSGDGDAAQVNVVVTEGEVEVLADQQVEGGRRLRAGEGVRSMDGDVEDGDDAAARQLTEHLPNRPELKNAVVVGDRWGDWTVGSDGEPCLQGAWRYYTNSSEEFGKPDAYDELVWDATEHCYRPADLDLKPSLQKFVRVHRDGGHPGKGRDQVWDQFDRYSITGFIVPEDGVYRLEAGWLERRWARRWDRDEVLDIAVHVNDGPVLMREFCDRNCFVSFRQALGELSAGDTIYVGVGPNGEDFNDKFRWGFNVVREIETADGEPRAGGEDLAAAD